MKNKTACQRAREALPALLVDGYVASDWRLHAAHVQWCSACARLAFAHFAVWAELEACADEPVPRQLDDEIRLRVEAVLPAAPH